jgi:hypothetical protein
MRFTVNPFTNRFDAYELSASPAGNVDFLTGDTGGAITPDAGQNINIKALYTNAVSGNLATHTLTITPTSSGYPTTPYVVGVAGKAGYLTIQSAINAANAAGGGIVVLQPGTYTENLTLRDAVHIMGLNFADAGGGAKIIGVHTPPAAGGFVFRNVWLQSATHIFSSAVAGTAHLVIADAYIAVTNGYTYNLPNWTGKLETYDVNDFGSTNDGFINNIGGANIAIFSASVGVGTVNPMIVSGPIYTDAAEFFAPVNFVAGSALSLIRASFSETVTCSATAIGSFTSCDFSTGINIALTTTSANTISLLDVSIDSSAPNVITGTGIVEFGSVTYLSSTGVSGTITKNFTTRFETGELKLNDADNGTLIATNGVISAIPGGGGGITWNNVTGTSQGMAVDNAYIANNAGLVTFTLPASAAIGKVVQVAGNGTGLWTIVQNASQIIHFGDQDTTVTTGSLTAINRYDAIQLVCTATDTDWVCTGVAQGNLTVA